MALNLHRLHVDFRSPLTRLVFGWPDELALRRCDLSTEQWHLSHVEGRGHAHTLDLLSVHKSKLLLALRFLGGIDLGEDLCSLQLD